MSLAEHAPLHYQKNTSDGGLQLDRVQAAVSLMWFWLRGVCMALRPGLADPPACCAVDMRRGGSCRGPHARAVRDQTTAARCAGRAAVEGDRRGAGRL